MFTLFNKNKYLTKTLISLIGVSIVSISPAQAEISSHPVAANSLTAYQLEGADNICNLILILDNNAKKNHGPITVYVKNEKNTSVLHTTPEGAVVMTHLAQGNYTLVARDHNEVHETRVKIKEHTLSAVRINFNS